MWSWLALALALAAECERPVPVAELRREAELGLEAWENLDAAALRASASRVDGWLPCADAPLNPADASVVHLLLGVARFSAEPDVDEVRPDLAAARAADPTSSWAIRLFPEGSPLAVAWATAPLDGASVGAPAITGAVIHVDGRPAIARVWTRPAIVQRVEAGAVVATARVAANAQEWPAEFLPNIVENSVSTLRPGPSAAPPRRRTALVATAVGSAVLSLAGLGVAAVSAAEWREDEVNHVQGRRVANRVGFFGMVGFGALAIGTGVAAAIPERE